jgi:hypothetical protein
LETDIVKLIGRKLSLKERLKGKIIIWNENKIL